jgi:ubiquinone/menaquinone biosynthesis C-methylase UbiE
MDKMYKEVIEANIKLHTKLSEYYNSCEPHFRNESIERVESLLRQAIERTSAKRMLDMGCGTGFMINIAKKHVKEITGVDVTKAMLDRVDKTGDCVINLVQMDTGEFKTDNPFDIVTGNSFLHHLYDIKPTLKATYDALRPGGMCYYDLDPNYYFWEQIHKLDRFGKYDPMVSREIEMVAFKDEDIQLKFGVDKEIFNNAEYGKNIVGGFKEEDLLKTLTEIGFKEVKIFYHWFLGQAWLLNESNANDVDRTKVAEMMHSTLEKSWPLSRGLFKYLGFYATK